MEKSSGWLPGHHCKCWKARFNISSDVQGSHPDNHSISVYHAILCCVVTRLHNTCFMNLFYLLDTWNEKYVHCSGEKANTYLLAWSINWEHQDHPWQVIHINNLGSTIYITSLSLLASFVILVEKYLCTCLYWHQSKQLVSTTIPPDTILQMNKMNTQQPAWT